MRLMRRHSTLNMMTRVEIVGLTLWTERLTSANCNRTALCAL